MGQRDSGEPPLYRLSDRAPPLVRQVLEARGYREWDETRDAEDEWEIHWKAGRFKPSEYAVACRAQRVNHFPKTTGITKKDCLLRNLRRMRAIHGAVCNFFPESYILPTEYMTLVRQAEACAPEERPIWILKPTDSSQGRKIFLIRDVSEISYGHFSANMLSELSDTARPERENPKLDDKGRAIQTDLDMSTTLKMLKSRLHRTVTPCVKFTEMHIVQRYVERPLTVCGYKLDLRLYVLLLSADPLRIYWYNDCLVRFATQKYDLVDLENTYSVRAPGPQPARRALGTERSARIPPCPRAAPDQLVDQQEFELLRDRQGGHTRGVQVEPATVPARAPGRAARLAAAVDPHQGDRQPDASLDRRRDPRQRRLLRAARVRRHRRREPQAVAARGERVARAHC